MTDEEKTMDPEQKAWDAMGGTAEGLEAFRAMKGGYQVKDTKSENVSGSAAASSGGTGVAAGGDETLTHDEALAEMRSLRAAGQGKSPRAEELKDALRAAGGEDQIAGVRSMYTNS